MVETETAVAKIPHGREWIFKQFVGGHEGILRKY
jgi:hypothetical protein